MTFFEFLQTKFRLLKTISRYRNAFSRYRNAYKNYMWVIYRILRNKYPIDVVLKNGEIRTLKNVIEVHDTDGRLEDVRQLLTEKGFSRLHTESEVGLEDTGMFNIFALR